MNIDTNGIELGDLVEDEITGVRGRITGVHQFLTGCARVTIQPRIKEDGSVPDTFSADVLTLRVIEKRVRHAVDRSKGGPQPTPSARVVVPRR